MNDANSVIDTFERFRTRNWLPGTTGALALLCSITENSKKLYVTPDQVGKKLTTSDLFLLRSLYGSQDIQEPLNQMEEGLTLTKWSPLFLEIIAKRPETRAVAQVTTKWSVLAARMALDAWRKRAENHPNTLRLSHWELLNELSGTKDLTIPIINFSNSDAMLAEVQLLLPLYPDTCAILVRDYGMLVWGDSFGQVERRIEILEYVCEMQIYSYTLLSPPSFV